MKKSIGRAAIFLVPREKLGWDWQGKTVEEKIKEFLSENYGGCQKLTADIEGFWEGAYDGIYTQFKVTFLGKEKIAVLDKFLEELTQVTRENCVYEETGEDAWLIYPDGNKTPA